MILVSVYFSYTIHVQNAYGFLLLFYNDSKPRRNVNELISGDGTLDRLLSILFPTVLQIFSATLYSSLFK